MDESVIHHLKYVKPNKLLNLKKNLIQKKLKKQRQETKHTVPRSYRNDHLYKQSYIDSVKVVSVMNCNKAPIIIIKSSYLSVKTDIM